MIFPCVRFTDPHGLNRSVIKLAVVCLLRFPQQPSSSQIEVLFLTQSWRLWWKMRFCSFQVWSDLNGLTGATGSGAQTLDWPTVRTRTRDHTELGGVCLSVLIWVCTWFLVCIPSSLLQSSTNSKLTSSSLKTLFSIISFYAFLKTKLKLKLNRAHYNINLEDISIKIKIKSYMVSVKRSFWCLRG